MDELTYIYALTDPTTGEVRYVGKADNPKERLRKHLLPSALAIKCRRTSWLKGLLNAGLMPRLHVLEAVQVQDWKARECWWISFYNAIGPRLVNTAKGGTGGMLPEWITDEMRANMSAAHIGKKRSAESVEKQRQKRLGVPRSAETIAKMSAANKGKRVSDACEAARLLAITGVKQAPEHLAKRAEKLRGNRNAKRLAYVATDPNGREHKVDSLQKFCDMNGLSRPAMYKMAAGNKSYRQHKGWTCRMA